MSLQPPLRVEFIIFLEKVLPGNTSYQIDSLVNYTTLTTKIIVVIEIEQQVLDKVCHRTDSYHFKVT
jgi:hypothetical protein